MRLTTSLSLTGLLCASIVVAQPSAPKTVDPVPLRNWPVVFDTVRTASVSSQTRLQPRSQSLPPGPAMFTPVPACRVADTRGNGFTGAYGPPALIAGGTRDFTIAGQCGIPAFASAVSFTFSVADTTAMGSLQVYPTGTPAPGTPVVSWSATPFYPNAAALTTLGIGGAITVLNQSTGTANLVVDVNGYFVSGTAANTPNTLVFRDDTGSFSAATITATRVLGAVYQDVAEWVLSSVTLAPGVVVVLDPVDGRRVTASSRAYDTTVAGVVSENPGIVLGTAAADKLQIAMTGRVRVFVDASTAPVRVGDLLVTSGVPGMAMRSQPVTIGGVAFHRPGTIIGKALEPLASGRGRVLVLLSLQ